MSNPYLYTEKCVERLFKEWMKHPKLIIAVDVDNTVLDYHKQGHTYEELFINLRRCCKLGFHIIPFTCSPPERYNFILLYLSHRGIQCSEPNKNLASLEFGNWGKIYYNLLLDDRSGLGQAQEILAGLLERIDAFTAFNA